jgi:hypothetical protein
VGVMPIDLAHAFFNLDLTLACAPEVLGSACDRRMKNRPNPTKNGLLGTQMGNFRPSDDRFWLGEGVLRSRVEML